MKKILLPFLLLLAAAALAACGTKDDGKTDGSANGSAVGENDGGQTLLEQVQEAGVLTIGTEGTYAPFSFHDASGKLTGYDVEVAEEVAARLGVEAKFAETQWDAIFAGLNAKRFDMIANQVGINAEREEKYLFSEPYTSSYSVLVVRKEDAETMKFEEMKGKKAAQTLTSNYGELAQSFDAEIVKVDGFNQAVDLVTSKRADGTYNDRLSALDYLKQKPDAPIEVIEQENLSEDNISKSAMLFRQGSDDLAAEVNKALDAMREEGTLKAISEKWFGEDVSE